MQYTTTQLPRSQIKITVEISVEDLQPDILKAAEGLSSKRPIEGFRPGKAPYDIVKQKYGEFAIYEYAADAAIKRYYPKIIRQLIEEDATREPIGEPAVSVTKLAPGEPLECTIVLSLLPTLALPDYKALAGKVIQEKKPVVVEEAEIRSTVDYIRESRARYSLVDRPAAPGDRLEIDVDIEESGKKIQGASSKNHPIVIGDKKFIPGFEDKLVGMSANETRTFDLSIPKDHEDPAIAGKTVTFTAAVKKIEQRDMPEFSDEFAKTLGPKFTNAADVTQNIRERLRTEKELKERDRMRIRLGETIADNTAGDLPDTLIDWELEKMVKELANGVGNMGMKFDEYLAHVKKSIDDLKKEWRKDAERRVKIALILRLIAEKEKIEPTQEEIQKEIDGFIMSSDMDEDQVKKIDRNKLFEYAKGVSRNEKVFQWLESL